MTITEQDRVDIVDLYRCEHSGRFQAETTPDGEAVVYDNRRHEGAAGPYATLPQAVWVAFCLNADPTSCPTAPDASTPDTWSAR